MKTNKYRGYVEYALCYTIALLLIILEITITLSGWFLLNYMGVPKLAAAISTLLIAIAPMGGVIIMGIRMEAKEKNKSVRQILFEDL